MGAQSDGPLATDRMVLEALFAELRAVNAKVDAVAEKIDALLAEQGNLKRALSLPALVGALRAAFGAGHFTAETVLAAANAPEGGRLFDVLVDTTFNFEAPRHAQGVAIGRLLSRLDGVEVVRRVRGAAIYVVRE